MISSWNCCASEVQHLDFFCFVSKCDPKETRKNHQSWGQICRFPCAALHPASENSVLSDQTDSWVLSDVIVFVRTGRWSCGSLSRAESCRAATSQRLKRRRVLRPTNRRYLQRVKTHLLTDIRPLRRLCVCFISQKPSVCRISSSPDARYVAVQCERWEQCCHLVDKL